MATENETVAEIGPERKPLKQATKKWKRRKKDPIVVELTCGSTAEITPGIGRDMVAAQRLMSGDQSKFLPALMSQLVKIDGEALTMEDFIEEMDIIVYQEIMEHFTDVNFPTVPES